LENSIKETENRIKKLDELKKSLNLDKYKNLHFNK
jgi:hypothetical protein